MITKLNKKDEISEFVTETLIVGAGPAGLSCAMELARKGKDFIIIEKDRSVGGLSKTYLFKEGQLDFRTDNGPHRFFSKNPDLYRFIEDIIEEKWIKVKRQTRQYIDGKFYNYPIDFFQALRNVGFVRSIRMGFDYGISKIKYGLLKSPVNNFRDYVYANFGKTLGLFNMIHYTEKIWGIPSETIHQDWAAQRIKGLDVLKILKDSFARVVGTRTKNTPKSLVDTFYYPEYGTGFIYETIADKLRKSGYMILLEAVIKSFTNTGNVFNEALISTRDGDIKVKYQYLVESVPLPTFLNLITPKIDVKIIESAAALRYRSQVYLFITLDKESITQDQWIYFPDKAIPFARISEMKNFSKEMSPRDKTSLFVEFFCFENDNIWHMNDNELYELALKHFEKMKFFNRKEVRKYYVIRAKDTYPIYNLEYKKYLDTIKKFLNKFENLYYIGRPGRFRYNNQDNSLEMGLLTAKSIIENVRYDIEHVGEEKSYQESGPLYEKRSEINKNLSI